MGNIVTSTEGGRMFRMLAACAATAAITAAISTGVGFGSASAKPRVLTVPVGGTAVFAGQDLICVNEPAMGAPRFKKPGVACSSYASPYHGIGIWLTRTAVVVTRPPNAKVVWSFRR